MANRTNLAYNYVADLRQKPKQTLKVHRGKKGNYLHPIQVIALMLASVFVLSFMIFSLVQLNEVNSEITQAQKELRVAQSENVRLNSQLETQMSLQNVAKYAEENLGLTKMGSNQVNYISISSGNAIEIPGKEKKDTLTTDPGWFQKVQAHLSQLLEYLAIK